MKKLLLILATLTVLTSLSGSKLPISKAAREHSYEFANGRRFDGKKFVQGTFYVINSTLTFRKPDHVDRTIDLTGKYVIPPFGEAHNHNLVWSDEAGFSRLKNKYLADGIFYVKNPTNLPRTRAPLASRINIPSSVDAVFSNGALTASGGHPVEIVNPNRGFTEADGEGAFYWVIDDMADLDRKWERVLSQKPDFIKTMLVYSEEYEKRKDDEKFFGRRRGLNPALLPEIVRRAHAARLRVSVHLDTAADFHNALMAGADEMAHMPGCAADEKVSLSRYEISEADARLAAKRQVVVVTTLGEMIDGLYGKDGALIPERKGLYDMVRHNLQILQKYGVPIAVGSDQYGETSAPEALRLYRLKAFDNLTLLKMWCEETAATIFPQRKIGHLKEGYEASFLVLGGDPLQDFNNVGKIEMRVKQGELLSDTMR
jgi:imidazolonepropionase-like amidohydrolase